MNTLTHYNVGIGILYVYETYTQLFFYKQPVYKQQGLKSDVD